MSDTKRRERTPDWIVDLDDSQSLRTIVEAVQNVVSRVTFKIVPDEDGKHVLKVDTADAAWVCCIVVRLHLDRVVNYCAEEIKFCIDCKHMVPCLSNMRPEYAIQLKGYDSHASPTVGIRYYDPETVGFNSESELKTFVDSNTLSLFDMDFNMVIEIETATLKQTLKQAATAKAEHLRIQIVLTTPDAAVQLSTVRFKSRGEFDHTVECTQEVRRSGADIVVRAVLEGEHSMKEEQESQLVYDNVFSVEKLAGFVNPLKCRMITARVGSPHVEPKKCEETPIMFEHRIGGTDDTRSYVRFLLAATVPEAEE